jgi:death-on-curing protein
MTYYLSLEEVIALHSWSVEATQGPLGIRDQRGLESAVAQPRQAFEGHDLYPTLAAKACALAFSLIRNHPFVDGNKRAGYYSLETFLLVNGLRFEADTDAAVSIIEGVAAGQVSREQFLNWIEAHIV